MSDVGTKKMLARYDSMASPTMFLSSHFAVPNGGVHNRKTVEIDVRRHGRQVAPVVSEISATGELIGSAQYTNKEFAPPVVKERIVVDAYSSLDRQAGNDPFADFEERAVIVGQIMDKTALMNDVIMRHIELQASTILQTGILTLPREGSGTFTLDFAPKATHFPTSSVAWGNGAEDKMADLLNMSSVIKADGKVSARKCIFGEAAWLEWQADTAVQAVLDNRRISNGEIKPREAVEDATFQGVFQIAGFKFEMWTYDGSYDAYASGTDTAYVATGNVIVLADNQQRAPLKATYGIIPRFEGSDTPTEIGYAPRQLGNLSVSSFFNEDRTALTVRAGTRPLLIPVAIDSFGCLDTQAA